MLFLTTSNVWSFVFFSPLTYIILLISFVIYCLPTLTTKTRYTNSSNKFSFSFLNSFDLFWVFVSPVIAILLLTFFLVVFNNVGLIWAFNYRTISDQNHFIDIIYVYVGFANTYLYLIFLIKRILRFYCRNFQLYVLNYYIIHL